MNLIKNQLGIISLPVHILKTDNKYYISTIDNETKEILGGHTFGSGNTIPEAEKEFWKSLKFHIKFYRSQHLQLYRWKPLAFLCRKRSGWVRVFGLEMCYLVGRIANSKKYGWPL